MRINKYLADQQYASRRGADELIRQGLVYINGRKAVLGDVVTPKDSVEVKKPTTTAGMLKNELGYFAYNKPVDVVTHSPQGEERDIKQLLVSATKTSPLPKNINPEKLFPIGRLDKDSHGLLILTNDGRITGKLLDPEENHEKEYVVEVATRLPGDFENKMERGVVIEDGNGKKFKTKPCVIKILGDKKFSITLTEGKKRQIRRMCESCKLTVTDLKRVRIMDIQLGNLGDNALRRIKGNELDAFLETLGVRKL
jgi:23S rRNA pseudouridine2604 synthase